MKGRDDYSTSVRSADFFSHVWIFLSRFCPCSCRNCPLSDCVPSYGSSVGDCQTLSGRQALPDTPTASQCRFLLCSVKTMHNLFSVIPLPSILPSVLSAVSPQAPVLQQQPQFQPCRVLSVIHTDAFF